MKFLIILCSLFSLSSFAQINGSADVNTHFRINGKDTNMLMPGKPATVEVWYTDKKTNEVFTEFKKMHGKIMHMVILKKDLSVFKHIHPYFDPVTGRFQITLNMPLSDPDNFHTENAITEPGMYMIMADVEIKHVGMRMGHKMVHVMGEHANHALKLDPVDADLSITKFFSHNNTNYKIKLVQEHTPGCSGILNEFRVSLFEQDETGQYVAAKNLEDWLTQGAHSVWVSEGLMHKHHMHFAHMHSMLPIDDSEFVFSFHDNNIMKSGVQKIWFQIKNNGDVLTIPVIFEYYPRQPISDC